MTYWKVKSYENIECAEMMITKNKHSSSIHCSYYSNIQLMLHVISINLNKQEKDIENEARKGRIGFHIWLKNTIIRELGFRNFMIVRDFNNFLGKLKKLRIEADYKNILISEKKARDGLNTSKIVSEILSENFKI